MSTPVVTPTLFKVNRTVCAASKEHYTGTLFEPGEVVWHNYTKKLRTGTVVTNISKTYLHQGRVCKRESETFSLPAEVLTPIENHA